MTERQMAMTKLSGIGFWLMGMGLIVAGQSQWAWIPVAVGASVFGYLEGRAHGESMREERK